jgi:hypothetical protein
MKSLEQKSLVLLKHHLKPLRLPTVASECEKVAARCATDNVDHLTYLLQVWSSSCWTARSGPPSGA